MLQIIPPPTTNPTVLDGAAEANHRIANNLSMIAGLVRMQASALAGSARRMSAEEVRMLLGELGNRIETIARLHRLLSGGQQGHSVDISDYLRDIAEGTVSSVSWAGQTELCFASNQNSLVSPEQALSLGLIVGELLTNAVKYAHPASVPGKVGLACREQENGDITIEVWDDGVGLPEGIDPAKDGSLGFRLVRTLTEQLGARMTFRSDGLGLCLTLQVPSGSPIGVRRSVKP
jgi:two-component sensor histidine kinase